MQVFNIPEDVINGVAAEIHSKTTKDYQIPVIGVPANLETPQIFEIIPFDEIDKPTRRVYAVDGSRNNHTFFNGVSLCFYQAGFVCFRQGQQVRLNIGDDPVVLGQVFHGTKMLVINEKDLSDIYDEFFALPAVANLIGFFDSPPEQIFPTAKTLSLPACRHC